MRTLWFLFGIASDVTTVTRFLTNCVFNFYFGSELGMVLANSLAGIDVKMARPGTF